VSRSTAWRGHSGIGRALGVVALGAAALAGWSDTPAPAAGANPSGTKAGAVSVSSWDWPAYGHDAQHTFHGRTTLTETSVGTLRQAWFFPTGDAVTATPTVVGDTVYAGSWDDSFYALNLETGKLDWRVRLASQNGITPYPGQHPRDATSDGGLVTASAWFEPAAGSRPALVIVSGGYTLYALKAATGALYWKHDYPGVPGPPDPNTDSTRIFSSPVVADGRVIFGVDEDGQASSAGYVVAASLDTGDPVWEFQTDVSRPGSTRVLDDSCGSVWSSGTVLPDLGLVVFGTADCKFGGSAPYADAVIALRIADGTLAWKYHPLGHAPACDDDFGASANAGLSAGGSTTFLGEGSKNGTYYSLDPRTGRLRWSTNVVFGGSSGGFIGTAAYDGRRVLGATALGDFLPTSRGTLPVCDPSDPRDVAQQNPTDHAFDAATGAVLWQANDAASFSATTVAGGMMFNGLALAAKAIQVRDASSGRLLTQVDLAQFNWSGIATVGDALVFGVGTTASANSSGIEVLTPGGAPPRVPGSG
jgi:outer membrane protein assembly factor BamB